MSKSAQLAWSLAVLAAVLAAAGELLGASSGPVAPAEPLLYVLAWWAVALSWVIVGLLVAIRQPRNPTGWILLGLTLYASVVGVADGYFARARSGDGGA
jgi:hypothetical protein